LKIINNPTAAKPSKADISSAISDQDLSDAYIYLLGRILISRQLQQIGFQQGFK